MEKLDTLKVEDLRRWSKAYLETKRDSLAVLKMEEILRLDPNQSDLYSDAGAIYMRLRKWDRAATMLERRFTQDTSAVSAYVNYALCNMQLEKYGVARDALILVTIKRPTYPQGHLFLARCYVRMDSLLLGIKEYGHFAEMVAGDEAKFSKGDVGESYGLVGLGHLLDKKYPQAVEMLKKSFKYRDDNPQTHLWCGQAYALSGNKDEAIKEYRVSLKLDPKNKDAKKGLELLGVVDD